MSKTQKSQSALVETVVALDHHFSELERIGLKITDMQLRSDTEFEQGRRMMTYFAEASEGVATEITRLSQLLLAAKARSEEIAAQVAARSDELNSRRTEKDALGEEFTALTVKVRAIGEELSRFQRDSDEALSDEERTELAAHLGRVSLQLAPIVAEAQRIRNEARACKMKSIDQQADSMSQTLQNLQNRLQAMNLVS